MVVDTQKPVDGVMQQVAQKLAMVFANPADENNQTTINEINTLLSDNHIIPDELTPDQLETLVASFKIENLIDNTGTSVALATYAMAYDILDDGGQANHQNDALAASQAFTRFSTIALFFTFLCGLSFVASSLGLVQDYRRDHARFKHRANDQAMMLLALKKMNASNNGLLDVFRLANQARLKSLEKEHQNAIGLYYSGLVRKIPLAELDRIKALKEELGYQIVYAKEICTTISALEKNKNDNIDEEINTQKRKIIDVLERPLYNVALDYNDRSRNTFHEKITTLESTSLYAQKSALMRRLAVYRPFTAEEASTYHSDEMLAFNLINSNVPRLIEKDNPHYVNSDSEVFLGIADETSALQKTIDNEKDNKKKTIIKNSLKVAYFHAVEELEYVQNQIDYYESSLNFLDTMAKLTTHTEIVPPKNKKPNVTATLASPIEKPEEIPPLEFHLKPSDTRTTFTLRTEGRKAKDFFLTLFNGFSEGVRQILDPKLANFRWSRWLKEKIKPTGGVGDMFRYPASLIVTLLHLPYFYYYAFQNRHHFFSNLKKVVDALHKTSRDIDQRLAYHRGDSAIQTVYRWVLRVVWATILFIPETLLGFCYFVIPFFTKGTNIAQVSRAINHHALANWVQKKFIDAIRSKNSSINNEKYPWAYKLTLVWLNIVTFFGGMLNAFILTPFSRIFYPFKHESSDDIRHSREQVNIASNMANAHAKRTWFEVFVDPVVSARKQWLIEKNKIFIKYPPETSPLMYAGACTYQLSKSVSGAFISIIVNIFSFIIYKILATAPLVTVTAVAASSVATGVPFVATFPDPIRMGGLYVAAASDLTNMTHDGYNLASALDRNKKTQTAEHNALAKMNGEMNLDLFKHYRTIFERIAEGSDIHKKLIEKKNKKHSYSAHYAENMLNALDEKEVTRKLKALLSLHFSYFLINTSGSKSTGKTEQQLIDEHNRLFTAFNNSADIVTIATQIAAKIPNNGKLTEVEINHYLLGMTALAEYDFAKRVSDERSAKHQESMPSKTTFSLYLVNAKTGEILRARRDPHFADLFYFDGGKNKKVTVQHDKIISSYYGFNRHNYYLEWRDAHDKVNLNKSLHMLSDDVTRNTETLCLFRGYYPKSSTDSSKQKSHTAQNAI